MNMMEVCQLAGKYAIGLRKEGSAALYTGVPGMLALMQENIKRFFQDGGEEDEIIKLAANALLCLQLSLEDVEEIEDLAEEEEYEDEDLDLGGEEEVEEDAPATATPPTLPPVPPHLQGWNYDAGKAAEFEAHLHEEGLWDKLSPAQQQGIADCVAGDVDQMPAEVAGRESAFSGDKENE